ncbi:MAG: site specific recombinase [uncultured bacterium]|nr:MAG: site specific recombinase [uncultured bacterium]
MAILSKIFAYAVEKEYISRNPAINKKVKRCTESDEIIRYLTEEEEERLIEAITEEYYYMKSIIITLMHTGIRFGELRQLRWKENMDLRNEYITLTKTMTKSKKKRTIPMTPVLIELFKELHKKRIVGIEYVFFNPKTLKPYNNVRKAWITLKKRAEIDLDFRIHDLRHSFATKLMDKNVNLGIIRELLGHSSLNVTQKYAHAKKESVRAAILLVQ